MGCVDDVHLLRLYGWHQLAPNVGLHLEGLDRRTLNVNYLYGHRRQRLWNPGLSLLIMVWKQRLRPQLSNNWYQQRIPDLEEHSIYPDPLVELQAEWRPSLVRL